MDARIIRKELGRYATAQRKKTNEWFFKTAPGEYGAHDKFLGIKNPDVRCVAKKYKDADLKILQELIVSRYNEERLCALIILVSQFSAKSATGMQKKANFKFYKKNLAFVNNWNLVDLSAPHIFGEYLFAYKKEVCVLDSLVSSEVQWQRRVCILATWAFIKRGDYSLTLNYAQKLLDDGEDLMHKAVGWMLREVWKREALVCENFLKKYYDRIPRTTLRYAIERMQEKKRKKYLKRSF